MNNSFGTKVHGRTLHWSRASSSKYHNRNLKKFIAISLAHDSALQIRCHSARLSIQSLFYSIATKSIPSCDSARRTGVIRLTPNFLGVIRRGASLSISAGFQILSKGDSARRITSQNTFMAALPDKSPHCAAPNHPRSFHAESPCFCTLSPPSLPVRVSDGYYTNISFRNKDRQLKLSGIHFLISIYNRAKRHVSTISRSY